MQSYPGVIRELDLSSNPYFKDSAFKMVIKALRTESNLTSLKYISIISNICYRLEKTELTD